MSNIPNNGAPAPEPSGVPAANQPAGQNAPWNQGYAQPQPGYPQSAPMPPYGAQYAAPAPIPPLAAASKRARWILVIVFIVLAALSILAAIGSGVGYVIVGALIQVVIYALIAYSFWVLFDVIDELIARTERDRF